MDPDANANGPVAQAVTDLVGGGHRIRGSREGCEERVALCVDLDSRVPGESGTNDVAVSGEEIRVPVAVLVQELRRARDVGEEKGDGADREIASHARLIIQPRQASRPVHHAPCSTRILLDREPAWRTSDSRPVFDRFDERTLLISD